jgi:hypothetical protein
MWYYGLSINDYKELRMKTLREFECLYTFTMTEDGIFEYNICNLLEYLGCNEMEDCHESNQVFNSFRRENNITYYAAPRETFWAQDGYDKCRKEGNTRVVMEDLS